MEKILTPLQIGALLAVIDKDSIYMHPLMGGLRGTNPYPAWVEAANFLQAKELIYWAGGDTAPKLTPKGEAYIHFLCSVPYPVAGWSCPGFPPMFIGEGNVYIPS